ncbi:MAG: hypothetical protein WCU80_02140 [Paludibacteraceae bacterium]
MSCVDTILSVNLINPSIVPDRIYRIKRDFFKRITIRRRILAFVRGGGGGGAYFLTTVSIPLSCQGNACCIL